MLARYSYILIYYLFLVKLKVRLTDGEPCSLYSLSRSWVRNGAPHETHVLNFVALLFLINTFLIVTYIEEAVWMGIWGFMSSMLDLSNFLQLILQFVNLVV